MSDTDIYVVTVWDDDTSFDFPLERRWFRTEDAAQKWVHNDRKRNRWWDIQPVECGDKPGEKE